MKRIPIGERWVIAGVMVVAAYILGAACWSCLVKRFEADIKWHQERFEKPAPAPLYRLFVGFNSEAQAKDIAQSAQQDGNYELLFYYSDEKGKAWGDNTNGLVKCKFSAEFAHALINKKWYGEIEINSSQCRKLRP